MNGFIEGTDRQQAAIIPERLDDYVEEDRSVRVIEVFIDDLDLSGLGFETEPESMGRPAYHPSTLLISIHHRSIGCHRSQRRNIAITPIGSRL